MARTIGDADGRFRFEGVEPGAYVVELVSSDDKVLAVGDLFGVPAGGQATTLVRLSSKAPWVAGFFGNAAAAAIARRRRSASRPLDRTGLRRVRSRP